jgi:hypothetical protein
VQSFFFSTLRVRRWVLLPHRVSLILWKHCFSRGERELGSVFPMLAEGVERSDGFEKIVYSMCHLQSWSANKKPEP